MPILNLLKFNPYKEMEDYFKDVVLPQIKRYEPHTDILKWSSVIEEDDKFRPVAERHTYLNKGKKFKAGRVYSTTYKKATGDKSDCYVIDDIGAVYSVERYKNIPNLYAYAKNERDILLFIWK